MKMTKDNFVQILKKIGVTQEQMKQLHREMEKQDSEFHGEFLKLLALSDQEIADIRNI